jgi:hypothetical protein
LARTRHHIRVVGSVLEVYCETLIVWFTVNGAEKLSVSSM